MSYMHNVTKINYFLLTHSLIHYRMLKHLHFQWFSEIFKEGGRYQNIHVPYVYIGFVVVL